MKYCTKCGNQMADDMLFCQKCGTKVESEPPQEPITPQYDVLDMSEISEPIKKKQTNKQGVRVVGIVVLAFVLIVMLIVGGTKGCSSNPSNQQQTENTEILCDVSKFANITSAELVELLGEPNKVEKTTTNGFAKFPCVYYDYNNASELGEVSFILINDTVVKLVSYNSYPYNDGKNLLESFNLTMGENGAKNTTDTYARFRCATDKVDDLWITNIDKSANTFDTLQVTYDMFYFEEWYIPLTDITEETNYQVWTQNSVKSLLKTPKTAKFPSILDWEIFKNEFYVLASAYVDAQNSFGATVRSEFAFVYKVDTSSIVYAIFDGEVIANNGYVKTEELVSKLIDKTKTDSALKTKPSNNTDTNSSQTPSKTENNKDNTTNKPSSNNTATPTFTGSLCTKVNSSTGMPKNNVTTFESNDTIYVAGKLSGVTGENNLIIRYTYPDGSTDDTMQHYIVNNETINTGINASAVGSGKGKIQVILEKTGKVLATYNFTVKGGNNIDDLTYVVKGVCSNYNSNGTTALNGQLYATVNSATSITIEHRIGDTIYSDTLSVVNKMQDTISKLFSETLNDKFPESISIEVYSTYPYEDCTKAEAEASKNGGDLDGVATSLTPEEKALLEEAAKVGQ